MKTPNSKFQAPRKYQTSMNEMARISNVFVLTAWSLKFGASLELGIWNLELY
jgi:hypothetical protein